MAVGEEDPGNLPGAVLRPVQVAGHEEPGRTLEVDLLHRVVPEVHPPVDHRFERCLGGHRPEALGDEDPSADEIGPSGPRGGIGGRIERKEAVEILRRAQPDIVGTLSWRQGPGRGREGGGESEDPEGEGAETQQGMLRTFLPWVPSGTEVEPVSLAWLWPLAGWPAVTVSGVLLDDQTAAELAPEGRLERLVPRLIGPSFPEGNGVHAVPLAGELRLALTERHEGRARFLLARDVDAIGLPYDELVRCALDNLARASLGTRVLEDGALLLVRSGDGLDSSRLLLPGLVATFTPRLGEGFLAGVPHRDALWLARPGDAPALRARIEDDFARAPHRISARPVRGEATQRVPLP